MGLLQRADWRARWIADPEAVERPTEPLVIRFPARQARYLRLDVTRLGAPLKEGWPDPVSRLQLAELEAYGGGELRSRDAAGDRVGELHGRRRLGAALPDRRHARLQPRPARLHELRAPRPEPRRADLARDRPRRGHRRRRGPALRAHRRADRRRPDGQLPRGLHAPAPAPARTASGARRTARPGRRRRSRRRKPEGLPVLARDFTLGSRIRSARLYAAGLGVSEAPPQRPRRSATRCSSRPTPTTASACSTRTYDVTDQLRRGANTLGVHARQRDLRRAGELRALHEVHRLDGAAEAARPARGHATPTARASRSPPTTRGGRASGPTTFSNWYGGEDYDARRELAAGTRRAAGSGTPSPTSARPTARAGAERAAVAAGAGAADRDGRCPARRWRRASGSTTSAATSPAGRSSACAAPRADRDG